MIERMRLRKKENKRRPRRLQPDSYVYGWHSEFEIRFNCEYNYQRDKYEDLAIIREWFTLVNTMRKSAITLVDINGYNETGSSSWKC
jgi:hypothetical protein